MKIYEVETPAVVLDYNKFNSNVDKIMSRIEGKPIRLRPHFKTHKCTEISKKLIARGAKGITCAKISEAKVLAEAGIGDVLIANQIVDEAKIERLADLQRLSKVSVCVDNGRNVEQLNCVAKGKNVVINCFVEFDLGMERCGVDNFDDFFELANMINVSSNLTFGGIQAYAGHNSHEHDVEKRERIYSEVENKISELKRFVEVKGIDVKEVSGGSTGTAYLKANSSVYTELQAGSFVYMDAEYAGLNLGYDCALEIMASVISVHDNRIVTDIGLKSCSTDHGVPLFKDNTDLTVRLSEEHGTIKIDNHNYMLGDKVFFVPTHCCTTVNLYDKLYLADGEDIVGVYRMDGSQKSV